MRGEEGMVELSWEGLGAQRWRDETAMLLLSGTWRYLQRAPLPLRALAEAHTRSPTFTDSTPTLRWTRRLAHAPGPAGATPHACVSEGTSPPRKRRGGIAGQPPLLLAAIVRARLCSCSRVAPLPLPSANAPPTQRWRRQCCAGLDVPIAPARLPAPLDPLTRLHTRAFSEGRSPPRRRHGGSRRSHLALEAARLSRIDGRGSRSTRPTRGVDPRDWPPTPLELAVLSIPPSLLCTHHGTSPPRKRRGGIAGQPPLLLCQVRARLCLTWTPCLRCRTPAPCRLDARGANAAPDSKSYPRPIDGHGGSALPACARSWLTIPPSSEVTPLLREAAAERPSPCLFAQGGSLLLASHPRLAPVPLPPANAPRCRCVRRAVLRLPATAHQCCGTAPPRLRFARECHVIGAWILMRGPLASARALARHCHAPLWFVRAQGCLALPLCARSWPPTPSTRPGPVDSTPKPVTGRSRPVSPELGQPQLEARTSRARVHIRTTTRVQVPPLPALLSGGAPFPAHRRPLRLRFTLARCARLLPAPAPAQGTVRLVPTRCEEVAGVHSLLAPSPAIGCQHPFCLRYRLGGANSSVTSSANISLRSVNAPRAHHDPAARRPLRVMPVATTRALHLRLDTATRERKRVLSLATLHECPPLARRPRILSPTRDHRPSHLHPIDGTLAPRSQPAPAHGASLSSSPARLLDSTLGASMPCSTRRLPLDARASGPADARTHVDLARPHACTRPFLARILAPSREVGAIGPASCLSLGHPSHPTARLDLTSHPRPSLRSPPLRQARTGTSAHAPRHGPCTLVADPRQAPIALTRSYHAGARPHAPVRIVRAFIPSREHRLVLGVIHRYGPTREHGTPPSISPMARPRLLASARSLSALGASAHAFASSARVPEGA
ncbi:hypothetical protein B0H14DRAFT_3561866 [Mycena olivaceomarginata]|nr:hypothetical protein B0H14DRAFT_3561866 [Mycena olivaceomarginata]